MPKNNVMLPLKIQDINELRKHLQVALEIEHATIPPYLVAMYSIKPGTNQEVCELLRTIVTEEMLHMILVANVLNAIGGKPELDNMRFIPNYPVELPINNGGESLILELRKFSPEALDVFLAIERTPDNVEIRNQVPRNDNYNSLAEFYHTIKLALIYFANTYPYSESLFNGKGNYQILPDDYYNAGGEVIKVYDLETALQALDLVIEQSHNDLGKSSSLEEDLSHYHRFYKIRNECYYLDKGFESQNTFKVDWNTVYNMIPNPKMLDYASNDAVSTKSYEFNKTYTQLIKLLHRSFNGERHLLKFAVNKMFLIKEQAIELLKNPISNNSCYNAGPTFEYVMGVIDND